MGFIITSKHLKALKIVLVNPTKVHKGYLLAQANTSLATLILV